MARGVGAVPEGWFDTGRRRRRPGPFVRAQGRLTTNGLRGEVFDYGLEFFEVGEFGVAVALHEEPWGRVKEGVRAEK